MLQQTTVAAVTSRVLRFVERCPTVEALASAADEEVLAEWAGLGYYARARNLIACARAVAQRGGFPDTETELRKLPGLGAYTAAAVAAIAFGRHAVVIDTNVERVVARLFALSGKAEVRAAAGAFWPAEHSGDFAQALMDLGSTICRPRMPACELCPLQPDCKAALLGTPEAFPQRSAKKAKPHKFGTAWWCRDGESVRLVRRPAKGMLGGMSALPGGEWVTERPSANPLAIVRHEFTHFTLDLFIVLGECDEGWWQPLGSLADAGLPTLYKKAVTAALAAEQEPRLAA